MAYEHNSERRRSHKLHSPVCQEMAVPSNLNQYKQDLKSLTSLGDLMHADLLIRAMEGEDELDKTYDELKQKVNGMFNKNYQKWYTESLALISQMLPARLPEFEMLYKSDTKRREISSMTFSIQDWLMGVRSKPDAITRQKHFDDVTIAAMRFKTQLDIVKSVERRFDSSLIEIRQLVQADLFDSELDAGRELHKSGFFRAAGVVAGVVLERHLSQVRSNHSITTRKRVPTISDYNDMLKSAGVIDVPTWRFIQRLGDLRNLCSHGKEREPTKEETAELLDGVEKVTKTLY